MKVISDAFKNGDLIPSKYTCDGEDINPPLIISDIPKGTKSIVLIIDDPDAPMSTWTHWVVWDINPSSDILENSIPGTQGINDFRINDYGGPCPPSGVHRYFFKLYALDKNLGLKEGSDRSVVENEMNGHILDKTVLIGKYRRI